jgi:hypothetical protein
VENEATVLGEVPAELQHIIKVCPPSDGKESQKRPIHFSCWLKPSKMMMMTNLSIVVVALFGKKIITAAFHPEN